MKNIVVIIISGSDHDFKDMEGLVQLIREIIEENLADQNDEAERNRWLWN